ncbi:MAG: cell division protein ZapA [Bacteroidaceae bacterium]|nr:cell division protein ZapA [Bacteroidaceae bacterium]
MDDDKFVITLRVAGDMFPLTIRRSEEVFYRKAAEMIDKQINLLRGKYGERIADKQVKMTALNFALNLVKKENQQEVEPIFERLEMLDKEIVNLLK